MLNKDLHKKLNFIISSGNLIGKYKQRKKSEFLNNLEGFDNSDNIPREYLSQTFDSIEVNSIAINVYINNIKVIVTIFMA